VVHRELEDFQVRLEFKVSLDSGVRRARVVELAEMEAKELQDLQASQVSLAGSDIRTRR